MTTKPVLKLIGRLGLLLPIALLVMRTNFVVDPFQLFHQEGPLESQIVQYQLDGTSIVYPNVWGLLRTLRPTYIARVQQPAQIVVLGSSRHWQIRASMFPGKTLNNVTVAGAEIGDYIAFYQMLYQRNQLPSILIVGIDPWQLNVNSTNVYRLTYQSAYPSEYQAGLYRMGLLSTNPVGSVSSYKPPADSVDVAALLAEPGKLLDLLSPSYFQQSLQYRWSHLAGSGQIKFVDTSHGIPTIADPYGFILLPDGSLVFPPAYPPFAAVVEANMVNEAQTGKFKDFTSMDKDLAAQYAAFADLALKDHVQLVFVLMPFHPYFYQHYNESDPYKILPATESYFRQMAAQRNIPVIGSFDVRNLTCDPAGFYDADHAKEACITTLMNDSQLQTLVTAIQR